MLRLTPRRPAARLRQRRLYLPEAWSGDPRGGTGRGARPGRLPHQTPIGDQHAHRGDRGRHAFALSVRRSGYGRDLGLRAFCQERAIKPGCRRLPSTDVVASLDSCRDMHGMILG